MYYLGNTSRAHLQNVHPKLVKVVLGAIEITTQDFGVHEGVRSLETQKAYFAKGATKTMNSKHLLQPDFYGHAVDLVPYFNGTLRWEWPLIWPIAKAMQASAIRYGTRIRWGGVWDRCLNDLSTSLNNEVRAYSEKHPGPDFLDGPHYELV